MKNHKDNEIKCDNNINEQIYEQIEKEQDKTESDKNIYIETKVGEEKNRIL